MIIKMGMNIDPSVLRTLGFCLKKRKDRKENLIFEHEIRKEHKVIISPFKHRVLKIIGSKTIGYCRW